MKKINYIVSLFSTLFLLNNCSFVENPSSEKGDFKDYINPKSVEIVSNAFAEPSLKNTKPGDKFQFIRKGYFCTDKDSTAANLIFNRTVSLKDSWVKQQQIVSFEW